jgi:hypothetical protein
MCYHKIEDRPHGSRKTIVGFYLLSQIGVNQPAFEVQDPQITEYFDKYYQKVLEESDKFLWWDQSQSKPLIDIDKYEHIWNFLHEKYPGIISEVNLMDVSSLKQMVSEWKFYHG